MASLQDVLLGFRVGLLVLAYLALVCLIGLAARRWVR